jgi:two-component system, OmpR family, sensor kinase
MRSLFARIWLSYFAVIAVTIVLGIAVDYAMAMRRAEAADRISPAMLAQTARALLKTQGTDGVVNWIMDEAHANPGLYVYVIDSTGRDLFGRPLTGRALPGDRNAIAIGASNGQTLRLVLRRAAGMTFGLRDLLLQPFVLLALAILASGLGSAALALYMTRPILRLRAGVRAFASGNLDTQVGGYFVGRRDELGELANDFDQMAKTIRAQIQAREELLRDVSHELRSPLARLRIAAALIGHRKEYDNTEHVARIHREVERLDELIGQILNYSRLGSRKSLELSWFDLGELIEEIAADAVLESAALDKRVDLSLVGSGMLEGDRKALRSAIENVVRNAVRFAPPASEIGLYMSPGDSNVRLEVVDRGPGVDPDNLTMLFEPFYRGDCAEGIGLGLAIASRVVAMHGGMLTAANRDGGGLSVVFVLPIKQIGSPGDRVA